MKPSLRNLPVLGLVLFVALACQLTQVAAPAAPTAAATLLPSAALPTATPLPAEPLPTAAATLAPSAANYEIVREPVSEEGQDPTYAIDLTVPRLIGPDGPALDNYNTWVDEYISGMIFAFKANVATAQAEATPDPNLGSVISGLTSEYEIIYQSDEIISLFLKNSQYFAGAAHPLPFGRSVNYSLSQAHVLSLEDLFRSGVPYLEVISTVCIRELTDLEYVTELDGAAPRLENYSNWNITPEGLLITFDPYQVAAYAAGYVSVSVPYAEIQELIDPAGPLGSMTP